MNRSSHVLGWIACLAALALLLEPASAAAHALFGDSDPNRPLGSYLSLGFKHMAGGWDHLLFITGVVLLAGGWRSGAKLISLFVLGHSLTLLVATLAGWQLDATAVDVVIALSLVYVGVQGIWERPGDLRLVGAIVFAFGLVHGLGLSTRLQHLGLPESGLVERILLFNVGVELGQLTALAVIVGLGWLFARYLHSGPETRRVGFGTIAAVGLLAAIMLPVFTGDERGGALAGTGLSSSCVATEATPPPLPPGGGHPGKQFFGPGDEVPATDLDHVVNDGFIVVYYSPALAAPDRRELKGWIRGQQPSLVVGAPTPGRGPQKGPIEVVTAERRLSCSELSTADLTVFQDQWFGRVRAERMG